MRNVYELAYDLGLFGRHDKITAGKWKNDEEELNDFFVRHNVPLSEQDKVREHFEKGLKEYFRLQSVGTGG